MMQRGHEKLNPGLAWQWQKGRSTEDSLHREIGLKFKEDTSKKLDLEQIFVWC